MLTEQATVGACKARDTMKTRKFAALLTMLWLGSASAAVQAQSAPRLYLTTETPPYGPREGDPAAGLGTDMVREIMARAHIAHTIDVLPWKRAYAAAVERSDACVYSTTRTPERERQFKWAGPIIQADWVLMARADRKLALRSLDDARRYRIGTYIGDARDQFLRERGFDLDSAPSDLVNPRKLMLGRIDLWAASLGRSSATLERLGYAGKVVPVLVFNRIHTYLACNRAVPDALVARMNGALDTMERDGTANAIRHKYSQPDKDASVKR
jgi:polar amino acid transport system substrate-binding protein